MVGNSSAINRSAVSRGSKGPERISPRLTMRSTPRRSMSASTASSAYKLPWMSEMAAIFIRLRPLYNRASMAAWRKEGEFSVTPVHRAALDGFSQEARAYARGRPGYPDALVEWLCRQLRLGPGKTAVDLGAGTGKFTQLMLRTGAKVVAVEPIDAMREQLVESLPDVTVISGAAESMPLGAESVDAVVCAQAFHWFASHEALEEIHRVLVPGGALGLVWNVRDESCEWV